MGNTSYSKLVGLKELKYQKLGVRLIFKSTSDGTIELIEIITIGKRADREVFITANKRRKKRITRRVNKRSKKGR